MSRSTRPAVRSARRRRSRLAIALLAAVAGGALAPGGAAAQGDLTAAVVDAGGTWAQFDLFAYVARRNAGGYEFYNPRLNVGVGRGLELGAGISAYTPWDSATAVAFLPNGKWRFLEVGSVAAAVGGVANLPLRGAADDEWAMGYLVVDAQLGERGPWITGGAFHLRGEAVPRAERGGAILSIAQPLSETLELSTSWVSGNNFYGYLTPGATISRGNGWLYLGYAIGNTREANTGPYVSYGIAF